MSRDIRNGNQSSKKGTLIPIPTAKTCNSYGNGGSRIPDSVIGKETVSNHFNHNSKRKLTNGPYDQINERKKGRDNNRVSLDSALNNYHQHTKFGSSRFLKTSEKSFNLDSTSHALKAKSNTLARSKHKEYFSDDEIQEPHNYETSRPRNAGLPPSSGNIPKEYVRQSTASDYAMVNYIKDSKVRQAVSAPRSPSKEMFFFNSTKEIWVQEHSFNATPERQTISNLRIDNDIIRYQANKEEKALFVGKCLSFKGINQGDECFILILDENSTLYFIKFHQKLRDIKKQFSRSLEVGGEEEEETVKNLVGEGRKSKPRAANMKPDPSRDTGFAKLKERRRSSNIESESLASNFYSAKEKTKLLNSVKPYSLDHDEFTVKYDEVIDISGELKPKKSRERLSRRSVSPEIPVPITDEMIFKYPLTGEKLALVVKEHDRHRLNPGEFLNDTVIEFCIRYYRRENESSIAPDTYFFNSFFYNQLCAKGKEINYDRIKAWTKGKSIFDKKIVFVPINENLHWYLAVIWNPASLLENSQKIVDISSDEEEKYNKMRENMVMAAKRRKEENAPISKDKVSSGNGSDTDLETSNEEIVEPSNSSRPKPVTYSQLQKMLQSSPLSSQLSRAETKELKNQEREKKDIESQINSCRIFILDSLGGIRNRTIAVLKKYIVTDVKEKCGLELTPEQIKDIKGIHADIPRQPNHCDCGVYLIKFMETILSNPTKYIDYILAKRKDPSSWFSSKDVEQKRADVLKMMNDLEREFNQLHPALVTANANTQGKRQSNSADFSSDNSDLIMIDNI